MLISTLAELAVSGSAAAAVCLLLRRMARGRLSVRWEDRMVKLSLFFALVPLHRLKQWLMEHIEELQPGTTAALRWSDDGPRDDDARYARKALGEASGVEDGRIRGDRDNDRRDQTQQRADEQRRAPSVAVGQRAKDELPHPAAEEKQRQGQLDRRS